MKKVFLLLFILLSLSVQAQKGFELKVGGGITFLGKDPWVRGGLITGTALYNFNGVLAIGPTYSLGVGTKVYVESAASSFNTSLSEFGLIAQFTFLRSGKFKLYGNGSVAVVKGKSDPITHILYNDGQTTVMDDSVIGIGLGVGALLNLGSGFYLNLLEYQIRTLSSDFMGLDKGLIGSVGPMSSFRAGVSYTF